MTTFLTLISSVLPGARSIRAPFFSGILWVLFFWLLLFDSVPVATTPGGIYDQAAQLIVFLGNFPTLVLASILVFVVGAAATFATSAISSWIGRAIAGASLALEWQWHAQQARHRLFRTVVLSKRVQKLDRKLLAARPDEDPAHIRSAASNALERRTQAEAKLELMRPLHKFNVIHHIWIPDNPLTQHAVGRPASGDEYEVAQRIIQITYDASALEYAEKLQYEGEPSTTRAHSGLSFDLIEEFKPDPLEALKALDNDLFVEIDRERSERELRVAIATPLIALSVLGVLEVSAWCWIGVAISVALLVSHSVSPASERSRILKLISLKGKETPAMRDAVLQARRAVLEARRVRPLG